MKNLEPIGFIPVYLPEELHKLWQLNELASKQLQELRRRDLKLMDSEQIMQHGLELNQTSDFLFAIHQKVTQIAYPLIYGSVGSYERAIEQEKQEKSKKLKWLKNPNPTPATPPKKRAK
jgi:hypothetical protein